MEKTIKNLNYEKCLELLNSVNPEVLRQLIGFAGLCAFFKFIDGKNQVSNKKPI